MRTESLSGTLRALVWTHEHGYFWFDCRNDGGCNPNWQRGWVRSNRSRDYHDFSFAEAIPTAASAI